MSEKPTYEELEQRIQELEQAESKRKGADKALKESEARYRAFVEDMPGLICSFLPGGEITLVNKAYCEYFAKTFDELVGSNFLSPIPESEQKLVLDNIAALTVESPTQPHEHQAIAPDGDIRWHLWTNRALFDAQGKIVGYQSVGEDITSDDLPYVIERFASVLSGELKSAEYRILAKSGKPRWIRSSSKPLYEGDKLVGLTGMFTDITEQKRLESELVQSRKVETVGTLAGGIAHDFNNILSAIIGYTELALGQAEKNTILSENLQEVFHAGERAGDLVKQILLYSRQSEFERKPVLVKLIAKEAIKFLRASLPTTIEISQNIRSDSLVMADPTQIHQVLLNLCTNAEHAMQEKGGVLEVRLVDVELDEDFTADHPELSPGKFKSRFNP